MGSIVASTLLTATSTVGMVIERMAYEPFGKRRFTTGQADPAGTIDATSTTRGFTGHEHLDSLDFIHMNARVYDPDIGRFLSPDPTVPDAHNPQAFNRYAYAMNNPLNLVDPDGFEPVGNNGAARGSDEPGYSGKSAEPEAANDKANGTSLTSTNPTPSKDQLGNSLKSMDRSQSTIALGRTKAEIDAVQKASREAVAGLLPGSGLLDAKVEIEKNTLMGMVWGGIFIATEIPAVKQVKQSTKMVEGLVYRSASGSPLSMTPRETDKLGLSAFNSLDKALPGKNQIIDVSKLTNLCAHCDNLKTGHVSITPNDMSQMKGWMDSRNSKIEHSLTKELRNAVIGEIKK